MRQINFNKRNKNTPYQIRTDKIKSETKIKMDHLDEATEEAAEEKTKGFFGTKCPIFDDFQKLIRKMCKVTRSQWLTMKKSRPNAIQNENSLPHLVTIYSSVKSYC